jgi:bacterioferritin-associated ferredoxin
MSAGGHGPAREPLRLSDKFCDADRWRRTSGRTGPTVRQVLGRMPVGRPCAQTGPTVRQVLRHGPVGRPCAQTGPTVRQVLRHGPVGRPCAQTGPTVRQVLRHGPMGTNQHTDRSDRPTGSGTRADGNEPAHGPVRPLDRFWDAGRWERTRARIGPTVRQALGCWPVGRASARTGPTVRQVLGCRLVGGQRENWSDCLTGSGMLAGRRGPARELVRLSDRFWDAGW